MFAWGLYHVASISVFTVDSFYEHVTKGSGKKVF